MEAHSAVEEGPVFISRGNGGGGLFATSQLGSPSPSSREANFSVVVSRRIRPAADSKKPDMLRLGLRRL